MQVNKAHTDFEKKNRPKIQLITLYDSLLIILSALSGLLFAYNVAVRLPFWK